MANAELINQILNYSLLGLFIFLILTFVLSIIIGIFKGVLSTTFKLVMFAIFIVVAFICLTPMYNFVSNLDFSSQNLFINLSNSNTGQIISIPITSIKDTSVKVIEGFIYLFEVNNVPSSEIHALAIGLSEMIIKYLIVIIDVVLIATLGSLFIWILWHVCFKHFIPKLVRKTVRVKWLAAIENGIICVVVSALFLMPFTSLVNTINQSYQRYGKESDDPIVNDITGFIDTYNDSMFAKTFFNWTVDENGATFDTKLLDSVISVTIGDMETSFIDTVGNITDLGSSIIDVFAPANDAFIDYGALLSEETLKSLFANLNETQIFIYLLPIASTIALNSNLLSNYIDPKLIDISDVDWELELTNIETMTLDVINSGILNTFVDDNGNFIENPNTTEIIKNILSPNSYAYTMRIFESIDSSKLLSRAIPAIIWTLGETIGELSTILPSTWGDMNSYSWGKELMILYDSLYRLNKVDSQIIDVLLSNNTAEEQKSVLYQNNENNQLDKIEIIAKNLDAIESIFVGDFDSEGNLINCDASGRTIVYKNGNKIPNRHYSLFDSNLVENLFPSIVDTFINLIPQNDEFTIDKEAILEVINEFENNVPIKSYKEEFSKIFNVVDGIYENPAILDFVTNQNKTKSDSSSILENKELIDGLKNVLPMIDDSKIINAGLRPALQQLLTNGEIADSLANVGLDSTTFDLSMDNLGGEIAHLLDALNSFDLIQDLSDPSLATGDIIKKVSSNYESIATILDVIFESNIINPKDEFYDDDLNNNFFNILNYIFEGKDGDKLLIDGLTFDEAKVGLYPNSNGAGIHNWQNSKAPDGEYFKNAYGRPIFDGENGYIAEVIATFGTTNANGETIYDVISNGNVSESIGKLEKDFKISKMFKAVDNSSVLSATFGTFLDASLDDPSLGLIDIDAQRSFTLVKDWTKEGITFGRICNSIDELGVNLNNLDLMSIKNVPALNKMLHSLASSNMFGGDKQYNFNAFLYSKINESFSSSTYDMTVDPFQDDKEIKTYNKFKNDFDVYETNGILMSNAIKDEWCNEDWLNKYGDIDYSNVNTEIDISNNPHYSDFYDLDYISNICRVIFDMNDSLVQANKGETKYNNIVDAITDQAVPLNSLHELLLSINEVEPLRMVLYHCVDLVKTFDASQFGFHVEYMNTEYLCDDGEFFNHVTTKDERKEEIDKLITVFKTFYGNELLKNGNDFSLDLFMQEPVNVVLLRDSLIAMNQSKLFHKGPFAYKSFNYETNTGVQFEMSVFQNIISQFVNDKSISQIYYLDESIKDQYYVDYGLYAPNSQGKISYYLPILFNNDASEDIFNKQLQEIEKIIEIISSLTGSYKNIKDITLQYDEINDKYIPYYGDELADESDLYEGIPSKEVGSDHTIDISMMDFDKIKPETIKEILINFNESDLLYDCAPNALKIIFSNIDKGALGEVMSLATPYYLYEIYSPLNSSMSFEEAQKHFSIRYAYSTDDRPDKYEIDNLIEMIAEYKQLTLDIQEAGITDFNDIFSITDKVMLNKINESIKGLLIAQENTYTLHKGKAVLNGNYLIDNRDLSAFEYFVGTLYTRTGIADLALLPGSVSAQSQLESRIKLLTRVDEKNAIGETYAYEGLSKDWHDEINSFFDFIFEMTDFIGTGELNDFTFDLNDKNATPEKITNIMYKMNRLDIAYGSLSNLLKKTYNDIGFNVFSSYGTGNYADKAHYYLTQHEFEGDLISNGEILNIKTLLNDLAKYDENNEFSGYITLSTTSGNMIKDFIENNNKSTYVLTGFIERSLMYQDEFELATRGIVNVDALFYYNLANESGIDKFIIGFDEDSKIRTIQRLINSNDIPFTAFNESLSLDQLVLDSHIFSDSFDLSDVDSFKNNKDAIIRLIKCLTYDFKTNQFHDRAFVASEIVSGVFNPLLSNEVESLKSIDSTFDESLFTYARADINGDLIKQLSTVDRVYLDKINKNSYDLLSVYEADGIDGILDFYVPGGTISDYLTKFASAQQNFEKMVYVENGVEKNSMIASLIYCSRINPVIKDFNDSQMLINIPLAEVNELLVYGRDAANPDAGYSFTEYYNSVMNVLS